MLVSGTVPISNKDDEKRKACDSPHEECTLHTLNYSWQYNSHTGNTYHKVKPGV